MSAFNVFTAKMDRATRDDFAAWAWRFHRKIVRSASTASLLRLWRLYQYEILTERHLTRPPEK